RIDRKDRVEEIAGISVPLRERYGGRLEGRQRISRQRVKAAPSTKARSEVNGRRIGIRCAAGQVKTCVACSGIIRSADIFVIDIPDSESAPQHASVPKQGVDKPAFTARRPGKTGDRGKVVVIGLVEVSRLTGIVTDKNI